jgi:hypothetical protein
MCPAKDQSTHIGGPGSPVPRKRKPYYPPARTSKAPQRPGAGPEPTYSRPTVVSIDVNAAAGRTGLKVGDRVRIGGTGLYAGEVAVIDELANGVIPSAVVKTDGGGTRRVRTVDLEPVADEA